MIIIMISIRKKKKNKNKEIIQRAKISNNDNNKKKKEKERNHTTISASLDVPSCERRRYVAEMLRKTLTSTSFLVAVDAQICNSPPSPPP